MNKNTKFLENLDKKETIKTAIHELAVNRLKKSRQKLEFYCLVKEYSATIEHYIKDIMC